MTSVATFVHPLTVPGVGDVEVTVADSGEGSPILLLHGGGGPRTVTPWAGLLVDTQPVRVVTPVHPGFGGTARPETLDSIAGLAAVYVALLDALDLEDVTVVGNSIGGWAAAEIALLHPRRVSGLVLADAVGIEVPGHPFTLPPEVRAMMPPAHLATLEVYGGRAMTDPTLAGRLAGVTTPTLVVWGGADTVADPDVGRAYAAAIPGAEFTLLPEAGHLPQLQTPDELAEVVWAFVVGVGLD